MTVPDFAACIKEKAIEIGFDTVGITSPLTLKHTAANLSDYIGAGHHGTMTWMEERQIERATPNGLWPDAKSVIMLGLNYGPSTDPRLLLGVPECGNISVYARGKDYHDLVKKRLKQLARWLVAEMPCELKVFVDTAPVMEKPLAAAAGLGWQGKHTNMVSKEYGSWLFLGAIYTTLDLPADTAHSYQCGSCTACLDACPTKAFVAPHKIDARRCISYLTIELKDAVPLEFRKALGNRIYGCDDCLAACPWNKFASVSKEAQLHARSELQSPLLSDLVQLDDQHFRTLFSGSPIKRIGRNRFVRNVLYAIGNSEDGDYLPLITPLLTDESDVVRDAAFWAKSELG
jgi:epoxyqueuosine reductase